ncbi:MAG TPA: glycerophosphodiester phosphodiesterase [Brevundimonas sp.]|nr:glycerophosphodiester phosphodiesterase [Brevundimonas sp.]
MTDPPVPGAAAPIVIAHRGASGERPEHTLEAYALAIRQGADFIEPDLVMTRDGILVARHENEIGETTDVAARPEFAARRTTRSIDGRPVTGWFTEDFTLTELKTLRARERLPRLRPANTAHDGRFEVPTLAEVVALAQRQGRETGRSIGIYPELKHPAHFRARGLPMEEALLAVLARAGLTARSAPVFIQCFEVGPLQRLRSLTRLRLVQLLSDEGGPADRPDLSYAGMATLTGLAAIRRYADGVGPAKALIVPRAPDGRSLAPTSFVADAHRAGLLVHPWTFRAENIFLPLERRSGTDPAAKGDMAGEIDAFLALGIDGLFTDHPAAAAIARKEHLRASSPRT